MPVIGDDLILRPSTPARNSACTRDHDQFSLTSLIDAPIVYLQECCGLPFTARAPCRSSWSAFRDAAGIRQHMTQNSTGAGLFDRRSSAESRPGVVQRMNGNTMITNPPKKAVILAAGVGSRLRPLTDLRPKPLVEVNGTPILHNALYQLEAVGVEEVTIIVGYRKDAIQYACGSRFGRLEINYVESTVFDRTGSAYSLWLARDALLSDDCYLLEGDVFFEEDALRCLNLANAAAVAAVAPFDSSMQGSAVVLSENGFISELRMRQTAADLDANGPRLFKTLNILRFDSVTLRGILVPALDEIIGSGARQAYTEELLAYLIERRGLQLAAARCDDLRWYEIDSSEDLQTAERLFATPLASQPFEHRAV